MNPNGVYFSPSLFLFLSKELKKQPYGLHSKGRVSKYMYAFKVELFLNVASGSDITLCNKIDKPLVVYRFSGNVMTSIIV